MMSLTRKNIILGSLGLSGVFCVGFTISLHMSQTSSNVVDIIQQSRSSYVEKFIVSMARKTSIQNELTSKQKQQIIDLGYKLWKENGEFPYDIFRDQVYKKYGSSQIVLQHQ